MIDTKKFLYNFEEHLYESSCIYFWDTSKTELLEFRDRLIRLPSFARVWKASYNMTDSIFKEIKRKVHGKIEDHAVIEITGTQGLGKSRVAQAIARKIYGDKLNIKNITFTLMYFQDIGRC